MSSSSTSQPKRNAFTLQAYGKEVFDALASFEQLEQKKMCPAVIRYLRDWERNNASEDDSDEDDDDQIELCEAKIDQLVRDFKASHFENKKEESPQTEEVMQSNRLGTSHPGAADENIPANNWTQLQFNWPGGPMIEHLNLKKTGLIAKEF